MALPTIEKTWQFKPNIMIPSTGDESTNIKTMILALKNALTTFGSNPWVVTGSSNKTTAGMDGVDRWNTIADIQYAAAGSAHSWIVLKQTGIFSNFEICIDFGYAYNTKYFGFVIGLSGFTGGSTLNRPTATTQIVLDNNNDYWYPNVTDNIVLQIMQSTDGECTRIVYLTQRIPGLFWLFDKPKNPVSGWTNPFIVAFRTGISGLSTQCRLDTYNDNAILTSYMNSVTSKLYLATEGFGSATTLENFSSINQISNEYDIYPISLVSETTGAKGRHGQIYDLWFGNISAANLGSYVDTTYPDDSTRQFWQCDDFIFPWDGTPSVPGTIPLVGF
jgi:hypothetical protein